MGFSWPLLEKKLSITDERIPPDTPSVCIYNIRKYLPRGIRFPFQFQACCCHITFGQYLSTNYPFNESNFYFDLTPT